MKNKRFKIAVKAEYENEWYWVLREGDEPVSFINGMYSDKASCLEDAEAFAAEFKNPPEVVVEE